ncbi:MAG: nucleotidyltransferase domain-containing protein [Desulfobacteraceae bacterium]|nr:nucleotidyltransferase domain-containing protein [Desulfobacteraceae bacterium]
MKIMTKFPILKKHKLFETDKILKNSNLIIHEAVSKVIIEGSRGLRNNPRKDSDIDLSLILDDEYKPTDTLCREILETSLNSWRGIIELDTALVFDKKNCKLKSHEHQEYNPNLCSHKMDCFGIYKIQKGFNGFVPDLE